MFELRDGGGGQTVKKGRIVRIFVFVFFLKHLYNMRVCMFVHYTHVHMCVCAHVYTCVCIGMYVCVFVCAHMAAYAFVCMDIYVCVCVRAYICESVCVCFRCVYTWCVYRPL